MSNYRDQLESYLKTLDIKADRVLDVGGAALPVKDRVKSWDVKEYKIIDNGLEKNKMKIDFICDFNNIEFEAYHAGLELHYESNDCTQIGWYDIVFCLELFEYILQSKLTLRIISSFIKDNGILYITFPFLYPIHEPQGNDYLRYTKNGAIKLLESNGFKILDCIPRTMKPESRALWKSFIRSEGMHASRGLEHNELGWIIKAKKC